MDKTKEYRVIRKNVCLRHPDTGKNVELPVGMTVHLTDAKAKALINKVELVTPEIIMPFEVFNKPDGEIKADDPKPKEPENVSVEGLGAAPQSNQSVDAADPAPQTNAGS